MFDDFDYSEMFGVEKEEDDMIEAYHTPTYDDFIYTEPEEFNPQHYEEYVFFCNLTQYNSISESLCNMETLIKMVNFIIEKFKEKGVYADVIINDKSKSYSKKHNRKKKEDIQIIRELIDKGFNNSQIERITGITRKTIAKYRNRFR